MNRIIDVVDTLNADKTITRLIVLNGAKLIVTYAIVDHEFAPVNVSRTLSRLQIDDIESAHTGVPTKMFKLSYRQTPSFIDSERLLAAIWHRVYTQSPCVGEYRQELGLQIGSNNSCSLLNVGA